MRNEVHAYIVACAGVIIDHSDMASFTRDVLSFCACTLRHPGLRRPGGAISHAPLQV